MSARPDPRRRAVAALLGTLLLAGCHWVFPHDPGRGAASDLLRPDRRSAEQGAGVLDLRADRAPEVARPPDGMPSAGVALDPSFAGTGFVIEKGPVSQEDYAAGAAVDSLGRVVVVGMITSGVTPTNNKDAAVWRYLPDGAPDKAFGGNGLVILQQSNWDWARNVRITADDRILVGGNIDYGVDRPTVWRLDQNGTPDLSFGSGGKSSFAAAPAEIQGTDLALDPVSGEIALLGNQYESWLTVGRFAAGGALKSSFGGSGFVVFKALPSSFGSRLRFDGGNLVVAGRSRPSGGAGDTDLTIWRYRSDGTLDSTFAGKGYLVHDGAGGASAASESAADLELDAAGNLYACGSTTAAQGQLVVWKIRQDGGLDPSFGANGVVVHQAGATSAEASTCRLDAGGRLVVAGTSTRSGGKGKLTIWRFLPSGALDLGLGGTGYGTTDAFPGSDEHVRSLTLTKNDRAVVCGHLGSGSGSDAVVWRLTLP